MSRCWRLLVTLNRDVLGSGRPWCACLLLGCLVGCVWLSFPDSGRLVGVVGLGALPLPSFALSFALCVARLVLGLAVFVLVPWLGPRLGLRACLLLVWLVVVSVLLLGPQVALSFQWYRKEFRPKSPHACSGLHIAWLIFVPEAFLMEYFPATLSRVTDG